MKIEGFKCPHCGAGVTEEFGTRKEMFCSYCGGKIYLDDEVQRMEYKEEKKININRKTETRYVDEVELQKAKNEKSSFNMLFLLFIIILILGVALFLFAPKYIGKNVVLPDSSIETEFKDVIFGKASEKMDLIVMEQELFVESTITKKGLFNWGIFKKNKDITYKGTAIYTVNLSRMRENDIEVNSKKKTVTIYVPEPEVHDLNINPNDFTLGKTKKGLLSFGELKMTLEEAFYIENEAVTVLKECAEDEKQIKKAEKIAKEQLEELFEKSVDSIDAKYKIIIEMY